MSYDNTVEAAARFYCEKRNINADLGNPPAWHRVADELQKSIRPLVTSETPRVDALMTKWDDDGATRGSAFIELRDLARNLECELRAVTNARES